MSPLVIGTLVALGTTSLATLISFRYAMKWTLLHFELNRGRMNHFDEYWDAKNMRRKWERTYRGCFIALIVVLLFSVGLGAFSLAF